MITSRHIVWNGIRKLALTFVMWMEVGEALARMMEGIYIYGANSGDESSKLL